MAAEGVGGELREIHLADLNGRLGAAVNVQLAQDFGDMRLDGRLGHAEFVGDLLVLQTRADHVEHAQLLRRQVLQAAQHVAALDFGGLRLVDVAETLRQIDRAVEHFLDRLGEFVLRGRLGDEAGDANGQQVAYDARVLVARHHHDREVRMGRTHAHEAGQAGGAGQEEVEQAKVDIALAAKHAQGFVDRGGFEDFAFRTLLPHGAFQRLAKERMVVDDQNASHHGVRCRCWSS